MQTFSQTKSKQTAESCHETTRDEVLGESDGEGSGLQEWGLTMFLYEYGGECCERALHVLLFWPCWGWPRGPGRKTRCCILMWAVGSVATTTASAAVEPHLRPSSQRLHISHISPSTGAGEARRKNGNPTTVVLVAGRDMVDSLATQSSDLTRIPPVESSRHAPPIPTRVPKPDQTPMATGSVDSGFPCSL